MEGHGVDTRMVWTGNVLRQPGFRDIAHRQPGAGLPNADRVMEWGVVLPSNHGLTDADVDHIVATAEPVPVRCEPILALDFAADSSEIPGQKGRQSARDSDIFWVVSIHSSTMSKTMSLAGRTLSMRPTIWPTGEPERASFWTRLKRWAAGA